MARVTGIGGIFLKAADPDRLYAWYERHLGLVREPGGGIVFRWRDAEDPSRTGYTLWGAFPTDTTCFEPSRAPFMVSFRVADLDAAFAVLRAEGIAVDTRLDESECGRFGWVMDPEGNRIELWEPPREGAGVWCAEAGHTFLIAPGRWIARGWFGRPDGTRVALTGEAEIAHHEREWVNRSAMIVHAQPAVRFTNDYAIEPLVPGATSTGWTSVNPALGRFAGRFTLVGDTILSHAATEDGVHAVAESLRQIDAGRYEGRGTLYRSGALVSTWAVTLEAGEAPGAA